MRARLVASDWPSYLPWVLLGLRAAPKEDHNVSAAELLYGVPLALPGELLDTAEPPAASFLQNLRKTPISLPTRPVSGQHLGHQGHCHQLHSSLSAAEPLAHHSHPSTTAHIRCWPADLSSSPCRLAAVRTRYLWTDSNHAWPLRWIQRILPAVAVLHTTLHNLVLRPPFWGGPCGDQQILQPGPGEIRQYYYIYSPVCSRLFNRIQLHIQQLLYW